MPFTPEIAPLPLGDFVIKSPICFVHSCYHWVKLLLTRPDHN
jgi:hypothetical protein